ncbi:putative lectin family integral membrane protein [Saccharata proteae CBS 121410]|uniref:Lectin family integral membrane protein n=1 Tax=Saccharata proteae CBS 121410 TaxID=1314787 RepID=A0A9P4HYW2_9PEZI|nr:putative lectin family integral membrane protein [Saccharata proteae CBS 121410]
MHLSSTNLRSLVWATFAISSAHASYVIDSLSFGHKDRITSNGNEIPGWSLSGEGHTPDVFSDRVILTPPAPGNKRGALWNRYPLDRDEFVAEFDFRASGQERSNGNLQIWLTQGGQPNGEINSVYTVGQFDGLVLSIDQYGGRGGNIRGFLNDGTISFKDHHSVDSLAFGHCDYAYRNRGGISHLKVEQTNAMFSVSIDDQNCFYSDKIKLPSGYYFGISAASAENPDSFEAWKFTVSTTNAYTREPLRAQPPPAQQPAQPRQRETNPPAGNPVPAASYQGSGDQFADLQNRIQVVNDQVDFIFRKLSDLENTQGQRHTELVSTNKNGLISDRVNGVERSVQKIESIVMAIQRDLEGKDYKEHLSGLQAALKDTQAGLTDHLTNKLINFEVVTASSPRLMTMVFLFVIFQVVLLGGYLVYKRRRDSAPKKYL